MTVAPIDFTGARVKSYIKLLTVAEGLVGLQRYLSTSGPYKFQTKIFQNSAIRNTVLNGLHSCRSQGGLHQGL